MSLDTFPYSKDSSIEDYLYSDNGEGAGIWTGIVSLVNPKSGIEVKLVSVLPVAQQSYYKEIKKQLQQTERILAPTNATEGNNFLDRFDFRTHLNPERFYDKTAMALNNQIRVSRPREVLNGAHIATIFNEVYREVLSTAKILLITQNMGYFNISNIFSSANFRFWELKGVMESGANYGTFMESLKLIASIANGNLAEKGRGKIYQKLEELKQQGIKRIAVTYSPWHMPYIEKRLKQLGYERRGDPKHMQALPPIVPTKDVSVRRPDDTHFLFYNPLTFYSPLNYSGRAGKAL